MVMRPGDGDPRHGTANGYGNLKCRCEACRAAWAERCRERKERRADRLAGTAIASHVLAVEPQHGRYSTYLNWSCRCVDCGAAARVYNREKTGGVAARVFSADEKAVAVQDAAKYGLGPVAESLRLHRATVGRWCKDAGVKPGRSDAARHGTNYMYDRRGCRCDECRAAAVERNWLRMNRPVPPTVTHGTYSTYHNYGCRCEPCRVAGREYRRSRALRQAS